MTFRLHRLAIAAALAAAAGSGQSASHEWVFPGSGNWSSAASWSDGLLPVSGPGTTLVFGRPAPTLVPTWTVTNDLPGVFALNRLELAGRTSADLTLRNAAGSGLAFTGPGARIDVTGVGVHVMSNLSGGLGIALNDNLAIQMGLGELQISAPLTGTGALTVSGNQDSYGLGRLTLSGANTFSGGLTLNSGNLILSGTSTTSPVGSGTFTINGGVISSANTLSRINGAVQLNADLRMNTGNLQFNGPITVGNAAAGLRNEGGNITLNTALDITGDTFIGVSSGYWPAIGPATLTLAGTTSPGVSQGTLLNTKSITVAAAGTLAIDNSSSSTGNLANRVNDSASVRLDGGVISFRSAAGGSTETLGATTAAGYSIIEARPGASGAGVLTLASLDRADRGVLLVRGQNLGNTAVANHGKILVAGAAPAMVGGGGVAGSTTQSIVPWVVGNYSTSSSTGAVNSFVTYSAATGFRPLNTATEYAFALGGNATDNVMLTAATNNDANVTVNALALQTNSVTGSGTVNVTSGAVLYSGVVSSHVSNHLNFGSAEGVFTTNSTITVAGNMTGSGGFTKAGQYLLQLSGDNSGLTGPLTIAGYNGSGSRIDVNSARALPGTGAITVYSPATTAAAGVGVVGSVGIDRDFVIRSGQLSLGTYDANSEGRFSGNISGDGGVMVNGNSGWGIVRLTGNNTYTGVTRVNAGYLEIGSDAQLGQGGALVLAVNTETQGLQLAGDWTTSRTVNILYDSGLNSRAHDTVLNGALTGSGALTKLGTGTLTINGSGSYDGTLSVYEGSLFVNGTINANVWFDGDTMGGSGRVGDLNFLGNFVVGAAGGHGTFSAGSMTMLLGSEIEFDLGHDLIAIDTKFLKADQGFGTDVVFDFGAGGMQAGQTYDLVRYGSTTFTPGDFEFTSANGALQGEFVMSGDTLQFQVTAVPEPGAAWMLAAGLIGIAGFVRRRRRAD